MKLKIDTKDYEREYNKAKFILGNTHKLTATEVTKIQTFHNSFKTEETGISVLSAIEPYFIPHSATDEERLKLTEEIYNWCWENNIPMYNVLIVMIGLHIAINIVLKKFLYEATGDKSALEFMFDFECEENREHVYTEVLKSFRDSFEILMNEPILLKQEPKIYNELVKNTYCEIRKRVKKNIEDTKLPLQQYSLDWKLVQEDINRDEDMIKEIINNPKSFSKINQKNHFLHHLRYDDLDFDENRNIIFGGHTKGLSIGYSNKAILLSVDKQTSIRELRTKIKHLEDYKTEESEKLIRFTNQLIGFINQTKFTNNLVQFKSLAKEVGMTKNQAKNYAKKLFSINDKSFISNFEDTNLLDK